jgi:hypothetical protein
MRVATTEHAAITRDDDDDDDDDDTGACGAVHTTKLSHTAVMRWVSVDWGHRCSQNAMIMDDDAAWWHEERWEGGAGQEQERSRRRREESVSLMRWDGEGRRREVR